MSTNTAFKETEFRPINGWVALLVVVANTAAIVVVAIMQIREARDIAAWHPGAVWIVWAIVGFIAILLAPAGFFIVNPNMSRVLLLFGRYRGTVRQVGFHWTNPFTRRHVVSLRAHNQASETIKVNDLAGNPIEIGSIVVWQVTDTAQASFDVEDYQDYVDVQIEGAVRELAKTHPYDEGQVAGEVVSLRSDTEEVTVELQAAIQRRLDRAGIKVLESRISHLAYAPEIASAMLQRQQASAVVAAREKIVEGAVGMVHMALEGLSNQGIVELDDERRATLVGNLLVVLCGQANPQPVLNTGSLYN